MNPDVPRSATAGRRRPSGVRGARTLRSPSCSPASAPRCVGKLPPAISAAGVARPSLDQAGFLLSMVQLAGMSAGVAFGALSGRSRAAARRSSGSASLAFVGALGAGADGCACAAGPARSRGIRLLLVVSAPGMLRSLVAPGARQRPLRAVGCQHAARDGARAAGRTVVIAIAGWRAWWLGLALLSAMMALAASRPALETTRGPSACAWVSATWRTWLASTLSARRAWLAAMAFAAYSGQWLSVIGFLLTIYGEAGVLAGGRRADRIVAAMNIVGNVSAGESCCSAARGRHACSRPSSSALAATLAFADVAVSARRTAGPSSVTSPCSGGRRARPGNAVHAGDPGRADRGHLSDQ